MEPSEKPKMTRGGKNLAILGVTATLIALVATGISLVIYHNSGDIYLDRSRPGFLPDEEELEQNEIQEEKFVFEKTGLITAEVLGNYLDNLNAEVKIIDSFESPFGMESLADERLGIMGE